MTRLFLAAAGLAVLGAPALAAPHPYELDRSHSSIVASWSNSGINRPFMAFPEFDGEFILDMEEPQNSRITVELAAASLWTGVAALDSNLKSEWYFDVAQFPTARFEATGFERIDPDHGVMRGDLTIKGRTHPVEFRVALNHYGRHPLAPFRDNLDDLVVAGFSASAVISRSAFDLGLVRTIPDEIEIRIEIAFEREGEL
ncbi:MAG: YceI family protein [Parvularculaceae bacterium]